MREILFRGKVINSVWNYGCYVKGEATHYIYNAEDRVYVEVDPKSVGQFTGLTDKNGRQIFEGDIVGCFGNTQIFEIKWCDVRGGYFLDNIRMSVLGECRPECLGNLTGTLEIIGNIYDNPELLEEK